MQRLMFSGIHISIPKFKILQYNMTKNNYGDQINMFYHEIIKTHSTVAFSTFYTTHFFRQFVALKKSHRQFFYFYSPLPLGMDICRWRWRWDENISRNWVKSNLYVNWLILWFLCLGSSLRILDPMIKKKLYQIS